MTVCGAVFRSRANNYNTMQNCASRGRVIADSFANFCVLNVEILKAQISKSVVGGLRISLAARVAL